MTTPKKKDSALAIVKALKRAGVLWQTKISHGKDVYGFFLQDSNRLYRRARRYLLAERKRK